MISGGSFPATGGGEENTSSNLGAGEGLAAAKVDADLPFKSLTAGDGITLASTADEVEITGTGEPNTSSDVGAGEGLTTAKVGNDLPFKTLTAGTNIGLTGTATELEIATTAEANTSSNLGTGAGLAQLKSGSDLPFKSLTAGPGIVLTPSVDELEIGSVNSVQGRWQWSESTSGDPGNGYMASDNGTMTSTVLRISKLDIDGAILPSEAIYQPGDIIYAHDSGQLTYGRYTVVSSSDDGSYVTFQVTADVTSGNPVADDLLQVGYTPQAVGEANTSSNLGTGEVLAAPKVGADLPFKTLTAGTGVTLFATTNELEISSGTARWLWNDATSGDPGTGYMGSADGAMLSTTLRISKTDAGGSQLPPEALFLAGDVIYVSDQSESAYGRYTISDAVDNSTYITLTVNPDVTAGDPAGEEPMAVSYSAQAAQVPGNYSDIIRVVPNVAAMQDMTGLKDAETVQTLDYLAPGNGGGNLYTYHATGLSGVTANGGFIIAGTGGDDWFEATDKTRVDVLQWGADPTGVEDSLPAFDAAVLAAKTASQVKTVYFPSGVFLVSGPIQIVAAAGVNFVGESNSWYGTNQEMATLIVTGAGWPADQAIFDVVGEDGSNSGSNTFRGISIRFGTNYTGVGFAIRKGVGDALNFWGRISIEECECRFAKKAVHFLPDSGEGFGWIKISDCNFADNSQGVIFDTTANDLTITNNIIRQNGQAAAKPNFDVNATYGVGIACRVNSNAVDIIGNDLEGQPTGLYLQNSDGVFISANYFEANLDGCIVLRVCEDVIISSNFMAEAYPNVNGDGACFCYQSVRVVLERNYKGYIHITPLCRDVLTDNPSDNIYHTDMNGDIVQAHNRGFMVYSADQVSRLPKVNALSNAGVVPIPLSDNSVLTQATSIGPRGENSGIYNMLTTSSSGRLYASCNPLSTYAEGDWIVMSVWVYTPESNTGASVPYLQFFENGSSVYDGSMNEFSGTKTPKGNWYFVQWSHKVQAADTLTNIGIRSQPLTGNESLLYGGRSCHNSPYPSIDPLNEYMYGNVQSLMPVAGAYPDTELNDATAAVNITGKRIGGQVYNISGSKPVYAAGEAAGDLWLNVDGTTSNTPV